MIAHLIASWKTTAAGLTMIITSVVHLVFQLKAHTADENAWTVAILAVLGGLGLMFAGDASQSKPVNPPPPTAPEPPKQP